MQVRVAAMSTDFSITELGTVTAEEAVRLFQSYDWAGEFDRWAAEEDGCPATPNVTFTGAHHLIVSLSLKSAAGDEFADDFDVEVCIPRLEKSFGVFQRSKTYEFASVSSGVVADMICAFCDDRIESKVSYFAGKADAVARGIPLQSVLGGATRSAPGITAKVRKPHKRKRAGPMPPCLGSAIFVIACLVAGYVGVSNALSNARGFLQNWLSAQGTIDYLGIKDSFSGHFTTHEPAVRYHFTVDGKRYTGDTFSIPPYKEARGNVLERLRPYMLGKSVVVYYDPLTPSYNVLIKPGVTYFKIFYFAVLPGGLGILFLILGIWVLWGLCGQWVRPER